MKKRERVGAGGTKVLSFDGNSYDDSQNNYKNSNTDNDQNFFLKRK